MRTDSSHPIWQDTRHTTHAHVHVHIQFEFFVFVLFSINIVWLSACLISQKWRKKNTNEYSFDIITCRPDKSPYWINNEKKVNQVKNGHKGSFTTCVLPCWKFELRTKRKENWIMAPNNCQRILVLVFSNAYISEDFTVAYMLVFFRFVSFRCFMIGSIHLGRTIRIEFSIHDGRINSRVCWVSSSQLAVTSKNSICDLWILSNKMHLIYPKKKKKESE